MEQTQAIQEFLAKQTQKVDLYNPNMEVQVNVIPGEERVDGKWRDDEHSWSAFRIPFHSGTDPHYGGKDLTWPIEKYVEGIGLTGWDWFNRRSIYIGFDFDSVVGHTKGLNDFELDEIRTKVKDIPWVTIYRSKGGKGYHLYVFFEEPVPTQNHTEHAGLARAVLSQLSSLLCFDFKSKVDGVGGVLWIWHRDAKQAGFSLLRRGETLKRIPANWKEHILVKAGSKKKPKDNQLNTLLEKTLNVAVDDSHRSLLLWLDKSKYDGWWWDADSNMLVCHTAALKDAHEELKLKGTFTTIATGKDVSDFNCFAFPIARGGWVVRRYSLNCRETKYWETDTSGWTKCLFNVIPDLKTVCRMHGGIRAKGGKFKFRSYADCREALNELGVQLEEVPQFTFRETVLIPGSSEDEIVIAVTREDSDNFNLDSWYPESRPRSWTVVVNIATEVKVIEPPDSLVRYTTLGNTGFNWYIRSQERWVSVQKGDARSVLIANGNKSTDVDLMLGEALLNSWQVVMLPFNVEYPGGRQWNMEAPQLAFKPQAGPHPTWDLVLSHIGKNINEEILQNDWCRHNEITSGYSYILHWISCMFKYYTEPLPYLFLFGEQNTGKSILHEAISLLFNGNLGYCRGDHALTNSNSHNGDLASAILVAVEEVDLGRDARALNRIKDWVTGRTIAIKKLFQDVYTQPNTTHWIQVANKLSYCPIFPGDTRITVIPVSMPDKEIPKKVLIEALETEAPHFLYTILNLITPESNSRLRIPVLNSSIKLEMSATNLSKVEEFFAEHCEYTPGRVAKLSLVFDEFVKTLGPLEKGNYTTKSFAKEIDPSKYPKGRYGNGGHIHIGNITCKNVFPIDMKADKIILNQRGYLA